MSAANRVQKVPFGKWTQLLGEAMSVPMRSSVVGKNRALKIRAHLSILTFLGFWKCFESEIRALSLKSCASVFSKASNMEKAFLIFTMKIQI